MNKNNVQLIDEKLPLIPLSRRQPFFYLEKAKIFKYDQDIRISYKLNNEYIEQSLPVASIGGILLGSGCSITSEAIRVTTTRGCCLFFTGGQGFPVFAHSTQHRSAMNKIKQIKIILDESTRKEAANILFEARANFIKKFDQEGLPYFPKGEWYETIEKMMAAEGAWAKKTYSYLAKKKGVAWKGKEESKYLHFLNHLSYSLADIAILHLGHEPNIGILHGRTGGGGLCYDLADVYKPLISLSLAFDFFEDPLPLIKVKEVFFKKVIDCDVIKEMILLLERIFK